MRVLLSGARRSWSGSQDSGRLPGSSRALKERNLVVEDEPDLVLGPIRPLDIDDPGDRREPESVQAAVLRCTVIHAEIVLANVRRGRARGRADGIRTLREAESGPRIGDPSGQVIADPRHPG